MPGKDELNGVNQPTVLTLYNTALSEAPTDLDTKSPLTLTPLNFMAEVNAQRIAVMCSRFMESYGAYCAAFLHYHTHAKQVPPELPFEGLSVKATPEKEIEYFSNTVAGTVEMMKSWKNSGNTNTVLQAGLACNLMLSKARMIKTAQVLNEYFEGMNPEVKRLTQIFAGENLKTIQSLIPAGTEPLQREEEDNTNVYKVQF